MKLFPYLVTLTVAGTIYFGSYAQESVNLMEGAITSHKGTETPAAPWCAYNTSTNEFGNGNNWQFRAEGGGMSDQGTAKQLFLRWNDTNSKWIYAYKIELQAEHTYTFTCDATTNDNQNNNLVICTTTDMAKAKDIEGEKYRLDGINSDKLWTAPLKVSYSFSTAEAGEYYLVFKSTNLTGNIIIRIANVSLVDNGEIDRTSAALADILASIKAGKDVAASGILTNPELLKALNEAITEGEKMTGNNTVEEIVAAKNAIDNASAAATAFASVFAPVKEMYDKVLKAATAESEGYVNLTSDAKDIYNAALNNKDLNRESALQARRDLVAAQYDFLAYGYKIDMTTKITNPGFEDELNGWNAVGFKKQTNNDNVIVAYKDGTNYAEKWVNKDQGVGNCSILQTVNLEGGEYVLVASAQSQRQGQTWVAGGAYLVAGEERTQVKFMDVYSVNFTVTESEDTPGTRADDQTAGKDVRLGFDVANGTGNWVTVDNFKLYRKQNIPSGVNEPEAGQDITPVYYDLQGRRIPNPGKGLYIVRRGSKVTKEMIR